MKIIRKLSVATLAFMLTVLGLYAFAPEGIEVSAADSTQANGTVFAGYYDEATFETPSSVKTKHAKYVDSSILGVKVQTKTNDDGTTDMRVISTVDSLNYANVGFDIWFAKEGVAIDTSKKPVNYETTVVLERIRATGNKVAYNYSPKVMDTESLYFITGTITKIKTETNQGSNFLIRPYWTTYDGTKVYGESKCVAIEDAANNNINMTVRTANPGNAKTVAVNIAGTQKEAEVVFWEDGYACVNIPVEDKTKLSSASLVEIAEDCECKLDNAKEVYRNLETAYTGTADTTWYSVYHTLGETEFVIVTSADLYGFADIVNNQIDSFAGKTVYQVADIELNANAKNDYSSWTGTTKPSNTKWTPIGIQTDDKTKAFKGTFDGQDHAIIGLYMYTGSQSEQGKGYYHSGLFGQPVDATIKNIRLLHSYVNNRAYIGAIAGRAYNVTFENIYTNARLGGRQDIGGIVGTLAGGKVINCWFDGSIDATADLDTSGFAHCGGIVGSINTSESTIASCLNTGTINSKGKRTGGFVGVNQDIRFNLYDSISLGEIICTQTTNVGAAVGQLPSGMLYVDNTSVYAIQSGFTHAIGTGFAGALYTLDGKPVQADNKYIPFITTDEIKETLAYENTGIVFDRPETEDIEEGYWVTTETHPILGSFKDLVKDEYVVTDAIAGTFRTDTSWVKFPKTESVGESEVNTYTIDRPEELLGLAKLVNDGTNDFSGDIIYLNEDIIFNVGDAKDWEQGEKTENLYGDWTPIGWTNEKDNQSRFFKGTFDGKGHTISGLYISDETKKYTGWHLGLFGYVTDATITDVRLQNTFFRGGTQIGSFASVSNNSKFQNLYSDAILEAKYSDSRAGQTGGIVSTMNGGTEGELTNCWFAGKVTSGSYGMTGGLIGLIPDGTSVAITGCLNSSTVYSTGDRVGGFIGYMEHTTGSPAEVRIKDSLNIGDISSSKDIGSGKIGAVIGEMDALLWVEQASVHTTQSELKYAFGNNFGGTLYDIKAEETPIRDDQNNYIPFSTVESMSGLLSKFNTGLSFDNSETDEVEGYWTATEKTPVLAQFAELGEAKELAVLTSWAENPIVENIDGEDVNTYTINSLGELLGFVQLVNSGDKTFANEIVYLDKDIVVNKGDAEDWAKGENTENLIAWVPIGTSTNKFAGTFDGKGHSISGIYLNNVNSSQQGVWSMTTASTTLKNFSLLNSYICGKTDVGAIVGQFSGTIDSIYNEASVVGTENVGGLVGKMSGLVSVSNSWNAGRITAGNGTSTGKFAGGLAGYVDSGGTEIAHCLNTGNIHFGDQQVGGIVGQVNSTNTVKIRDSLNTGNITCGHTDGVEERNAGSVVGYHLDGTLNIASTYGYAKNGIGVSGGYNTTHVTSGEIVGSATNITSINDIYGINVFDGKLDTTFWEARENDVPIPRKLAYLLDETELVRVDISWDDGNKNIQLSDSADLYGLALLSQKKDFNGYTFTLSNNIVVNDVLITETSSKTGLKTWLPIGNATHPFAGSFNGNGYSISGIYLNASTQSLQGLFSITSTGAVLQNFSLLNSYISGCNDTGAIVGKLVGTVQSVYNEAFVAGINKVGGLVGTVDGMSDISSCWNAGNIKAGDGTTSGAYVGGIVGYINAGETNISHCLNTGNIHFGNQQAGGIVGQVYSKTTINDCLNIGKITTGHAHGVENRNAASVVGYHVDGILTISFTYGYAENGIGVSGGYNGEKVIEEEIVGKATKITDCTTFYDASALVSNKLDYHFWTARKAAVPVPTGVAHTIDSSDIFAINTSWDSENETNITLSNMADLYGFALLSQSKNFEGYTFTLSENIVVNDVSITEETNKETLIEWIPIGNKDHIFAGNFDGAGHTISGVYAKGTSNVGLFYATTGTLQNFRLENSWFEGSGDFVASVVANYATGTIEKVYSNATVRSKREVAGGLVGSVNASGKLTMSECWFAGSVKATGYAGNSGPGYEIGGLIGEVKDKCTLELTHALNTGSVYSNGKRVGGLIGAVTNTGQVSIQDSLNAGKVEGLDYVGTIIGYISATSAVDFGENTTYGINDYASTAIGKKDVTTNSEGKITQKPTISGSVQTSTIKDRLIGYVGTTAGLNFTNYWSLINEGTPVLKAFVGEGKVVAQSEIYDGSVINALLQLSYWENLTIANAEDKGTGNYMITIENPELGATDGSTVKSYYGYLKTLGENDFTAYTNDNGLNGEGVYNAIYTMGLDTADTVSDDWVVNVTYISYKENDSVTPKIYITFNTGQPLSTHLKATDVASVKYSAMDGYSVAQDKVTFSMLESSYAGFGAAGYIMQLKNGHFVVIDGGILDDAKYVIEYLKSLSVDENGTPFTPIVEAWVFSHSHSDHMGTVLGITKNVDAYKNQIYVEGFYYNEPNEEIFEKYGTGAYELTKALRDCASNVLKTTKGNVPQIYRMQTGQRYTFDDVTMDIMLSQELLTMDDYAATFDTNNSYQQDSFNDTSTWCMFTIGEGTDAQKLFTGGDGSYSGKNYICDIYSSDCLTVDVMTALHHGLNTNMSDYKNMENEVLSKPKQEEFSEKVKVTSVVLYSYKYDMCKKETNAKLPNGNQAVNWAYAKLNKSFIEHLASKSDTFRDGILVNNNGTAERKNYLYFGEGACKLTFHGDTITATVAPFAY